VGGRKINSSAKHGASSKVSQVRGCAFGCWRRRRSRLCRRPAHSHAPKQDNCYPDSKLRAACTHGRAPGRLCKAPHLHSAGSPKCLFSRSDLYANLFEFWLLACAPGQEISSSRSLSLPGVFTLNAPPACHTGVRIDQFCSYKKVRLGLAFKNVAFNESSSLHSFQGGPRDH
jgi:hypothetical protein